MNLNQYLSLLKLYAFSEDRQVLPIKVHDDELEFLIKEGYIIQENESAILTDKGREVFEGAEDDLFEEFFSTYPHKVPDGVGGHRVLGTKDHNTQFGSNIKKKWHKITKNNKSFQQDIIDALKYELNYRKRTNGLQFMQGMEVWLNKATWEKYIDLAREEEPKRETKIL